jgi:hypothetical protein
MPTKLSARQQSRNGEIGGPSRIENLQTSRMRFYIRLAAAFLIFVAVFLVLANPHRPKPARKLRGFVMTETELVAGAKVRFQGLILSTLSKSDGTFELPGLSHTSQQITAWKEGFFIGSSPADADPLIIKLKRLPAQDNENYAWVEPSPDAARPQNCGNCHREIYEEWSASGHARSATNRRFLNLYDGSDWQGRPHVGWSLRDDHPDGIGVCNACHAPTAPFDTDLRSLSGDAVHGVHCDFCHKIAKASTERIGFTHGRYGLELLRPRQGQIFFGPLDDVDRGEDSYSPIYQESRYCASCHEGVVFGVPVYTTYSEWLDSPARKEGKQCQTCHMAPTGKMSNIAPGKGGIDRNPDTLGNHRFFAPSQIEMVRRCLHVSAEATPRVDGLEATVYVQADDVGHRVPTGFVDRNLLLIVEALGPNDSPISPTQGPTIPSYAGHEWAGKAGKVYAKRLTDFNGNGPVPFWRAKPEVEDNRLISGQTDMIQWRFPAASNRLRVRVIYRRFWPETAIVKGWPKDDDITVVDQQISMSPKGNSTE